MFNKPKVGTAPLRISSGEVDSQIKVSSSPNIYRAQSKYREKIPANGEERNQQINNVYIRSSNAKKTTTSAINQNSREVEYDQGVSLIKSFKSSSQQRLISPTLISSERNNKMNFVIMKEASGFPRIQRVAEDINLSKQFSQKAGAINEQKNPITYMSSPYELKRKKYFLQIDKQIVMNNTNSFNLGFDDCKNIQDFKKMKSISQQNIQKINENIQKLTSLQDNLKRGNVDFLFSSQPEQSQKPQNIVPVINDRHEKLEKINLNASLILYQQQSNGQQTQINFRPSSIATSQPQLLQNNQMPLQPIQPIALHKKSPTDIIKPYLQKQNLKMSMNKQRANVLINNINQIENNNRLLKEQSLNQAATSSPPKDNYFQKFKRDFEKEEQKNKQNNIVDLRMILNKTLKKTNQLVKFIINKKKKETVFLNDDEIKLYGQRCPVGYSKLEILGKGGFAVVWLCEHNVTKQRVAAKQIVNKNNFESVQRELNFLSYFYNNDGSVKSQFQSEKRIQYMAGLIEVQREQKDTWIIYELGGITVSKLFYKLRGDFYHGDRVYKIQFNPQYYSFYQLNDNTLMKDFIIRCTSVLQFFTENKIVHCDIKPENILLSLKYHEQDLAVESLKIIDFGSSLNFTEKGPINIATTEYMPPEVINLFINERNGNINHNSMIEYLNSQGHIDVIDVWSLGASLLEILTGIPQWMNYKCKVQYNNKQVIKNGLFSIRNQDYEKLYNKQKLIQETLPSYLGNVLPMFDNQEKGELLIDLIAQMLKFNPADRIKPQDILKHPFVNEFCSSQSIEQCRANVFEMFNKNNNQNTNTAQNQQTTGIDSNNLSNNPPTLGRNNISTVRNQSTDGNKHRDISSELNNENRKYFYDKNFKVKSQFNINLKEVQDNMRKDRNKSSILISQQQGHGENSLYSPNVSIQEMNTRNILSRKNSPNKQQK